MEETEERIAFSWEKVPQSADWGGCGAVPGSISHLFPKKAKEVLMSYSSNPRLTAYSRKLRKEMTKEERHLWYDFLKLLNISFHRQKTIGQYIVDFYCDKAKLIIELDGAQHFETTGVAEDRSRDLFLSNSGYTILRYANCDVNRNFRGVCEDILAHLPEKTKVQ